MTDGDDEERIPESRKVRYYTSITLGRMRLSVYVTPQTLCLLSLSLSPLYHSHTPYTAFLCDDGLPVIASGH